MPLDVYQTITDQIIAHLEKGVRPWMMPWSVEQVGGTVRRPLRATGEPYQGINILVLWARAIEQGYAAPMWMTYRQAKELGGQVRKGEKGALVVYANTMMRTETNEKGEDEDRAIPFLKGYTVFNVEQIDGLPERFAPILPEPVNEGARDAKAEAFFSSLGADIRHGGGRAFYARGEDRIQMPPFAVFREAEGYYATLAHECTHWTMHPARLDRDLGGKRFGDDGYAMEELVAELGAAFLCADLGLEPEVREDHAAYIDHWLAVLKSDKRAIFTAASKASEAATWLKAKAERGAA